jgi:transposase
MIIDWSTVKIFIKPGVTDMRRQMNGLSIMIKDELHCDPFSGNLFLFSNKRNMLLKIIYWDRNGFCLWSKRLERDKFPWPKNEQEVIEITQEKFRMLLDGINFWNAHKKLNFSEIN